LLERYRSLKKNNVEISVPEVLTSFESAEDGENLDSPTKPETIDPMTKFINNNQDQHVVHQSFNIGDKQKSLY